MSIAHEIRKFLKNPTNIIKNNNIKTIHHSLLERIRCGSATALPAPGAGSLCGQAQAEWHNSLEKENILTVSEANILSTFEQLHRSKGEVFERRVINVFKNPSWDYCTPTGDRPDFAAPRTEHPAPHLCRRQGRFYSLYLGECRMTALQNAD
ncbi:DUF4942 domain-containing protein [Serratia plymuthica]|nr:DUF4942 domain-containing protein [Serratia plymuthica]